MNKSLNICSTQCQVIGHGGVICFPFQVVQLPFNKSLLHLFERRGEQQLYEKFEKNNKERQTKELDLI